jgi:predicted nucleotidyltransferase
VGKLFNPFVDREKEELFLRELRRLALSLLEGRECTLYLFGSRARGDFFRSSDADLAVEGLSEEEFYRFKWELEEALEESSVPFPVDLIRLEEATEKLREVILREGVRWK